MNGATELGRSMPAAGERAHAEAALGKDGDGHRAAAASGTDRHRLARAHARRQRHQPIVFEPRHLAIGAEMGSAGRPKVDRGLPDLIQWMSRENPLWGAPRIHGELLMLGFEVARSTVSKYVVRSRKPPSQAWKTFLRITLTRPAQSICAWSRHRPLIA
jgi:hypothetical protein